MVETMTRPPEETGSRKRNTSGPKTRSPSYIPDISELPDISNLPSPKQLALTFPSSAVQISRNQPDREQSEPRESFPPPSSPPVDNSLQVVAFRDPRLQDRTEISSPSTNQICGGTEPQLPVREIRLDILNRVLKWQGKWLDVKNSFFFFFINLYFLFIYFLKTYYRNRKIRANHPLFFKKY